MDWVCWDGKSARVEPGLEIQVSDDVCFEVTPFS